LLATGEAIGSTYDFTGEGIGKALETGLLAARALGAELCGPSSGAGSGDPAQGRAGSPSPADAGRAGAGDSSDARVLEHYAALVAALRPRFGLYAKANQVNRHPWLADLVIWRARRSERLLRRMTGVLEETTNPGHLLTPRGLFKLLFQ
jgi:hypothetical protein